MASLPDRPEIDFLILADRAEAVNGKLYMMGGGWDRLSVPDFGQPSAFGLAVGVLVPWNGTNENHVLRIALEQQDGNAIGQPITVTVNVGRPPWSIPGQAFRAIIAVNGIWKLPAADTYCAVATLSDGEPRRTVFYALQAGGAPTAQPKSEP